jgi:hypothetical protein
VTGVKPLCRLQVALREVIWEPPWLSFNAGKLVSVVFTVNTASLVPLAEKATVGAPPLVTPVQPLANPTL